MGQSRVNECNEARQQQRLQSSAEMNCLQLHDVVIEICILIGETLDLFDLGIFLLYYLNKVNSII